MKYSPLNLLTGSGLLIFFCLMFNTSLAEAKEIRLKIAVIAPVRTIWGQKLKAAAKEIKEKTDGRVTLQIYFGGVQGDELKVVQKIRIGQLHGAGFMARGMSKVCPDSLVFTIPMLFHNDEEAIRMNEKMQDYFQQQAREKGFEIIGWTNQGFTYCFSKDRVDNLDKLRQAKPWMLENDEFCKSLFKVSNISAVPVQVGDVMTALQSGMIHTVFAPPIGMIIMQWHTRVKYFLELGLFYSFGAVVISKQEWDKIPANDQKIVREIFLKYIDELNGEIKKQNDDAVKVLTKNLTLLKPSDAAIQEFRGVTEKVEVDMIKQEAFSPEAMNLLKKYLQEYRAKNKQQ